jgi:hypothetical protein
MINDKRNPQIKIEPTRKAEHSFHEGLVQSVVIDHSYLKPSHEKAKIIMGNMNTAMKVRIDEKENNGVPK